MSVLQEATFWTIMFGMLMALLTYMNERNANKKG